MKRSGLLSHFCPTDYTCKAVGLTFLALRLDGVSYWEFTLYLLFSPRPAIYNVILVFCCYHYLLGTTNMLFLWLDIGTKHVILVA